MILVRLPGLAVVVLLTFQLFYRFASVYLSEVSEVVASAASASCPLSFSASGLGVENVPELCLHCPSQQHYLLALPIFRLLPHLDRLELILLLVLFYLSTFSYEFFGFGRPRKRTVFCMSGMQQIRIKILMSLTHFVLGKVALVVDGLILCHLRHLHRERFHLHDRFQLAYFLPGYWR